MWLVCAAIFVVWMVVADRRRRAACAPRSATRRRRRCCARCCAGCTGGRRRSSAATFARCAAPKASPRGECPAARDAAGSRPGQRGPTAVRRCGHLSTDRAAPRRLRGMPTWDDVVAIGTRLPGVEVTTSYGTPALKAAGGFMCRLRTDPDALVLRVGRPRRTRGAAAGPARRLLHDAALRRSPLGARPRCEVVDAQRARRAARGGVAPAGAQARRSPRTTRRAEEAGGGRGRAAPATLRHS